jgi:hypothetical protein
VRAISESGHLRQRLMRGAHHRLGVTLPPKFDRRFHRDGRGTVSVYDTGHHRIFGVSQAQSGERTLSFTSQDDGLVRVADLPRVAV